MDNIEHAQKAQEIYEFLRQSKWFSGVEDLKPFSAQLYATYRSFFDVLGIVKIAEGYLWLHDGKKPRSNERYTDFKKFLFNWLKNEASGSFRKGNFKPRKEDQETGGSFKSKSKIVSAGGDEPKQITKGEIKQIQKTWEKFKDTGQIELNFDKEVDNGENHD